MSCFLHEKVFFFLHPPTFRQDGSYTKAYHYYQHAPIVLAEGLQKLGIKFYANINYWRTSWEEENYLFNYDPSVSPQDCSIVVVDHVSFLCSGSLPSEIAEIGKTSKLVYLDLSDEDPRKDIFHEDFRVFDYIFKSHINAFSWYPKNVRPWMFGLSNRILDSLTTIPDFDSRKKEILINFRHTQHPHTLRKFVEKSFANDIEAVFPVNNTIDKSINPSSDDFDLAACPLGPSDLMHCVQTSGRHFPGYYQRLTHTLASACFGGFFISPWPKNQSTSLSKNLRRLITRLNLRTSRIIQWDSWRLWESLAAGCVTFHVDFDKYGFCLPTMPQNWKHYIGIDLDNIQASIERIADEPEILKHISIEGRNWAVAHYSPIAIAEYFLNTISDT